MSARRVMSLVLVCACLAGLSACTEKPQTATARKVDGRASDGPASGYTVAGWKPGDATSWEQQLKARSQGQNEYAKTGPH